MNQRINNFFASSLFKIFLAIIIVFALNKFYLNYREIIQIKEQICRMNQEIELARERKLKLIEEIKNINDPEYIEEIARKELGLVKPGELLLIPVEDGAEDKDKDKDS